MEAERAHTVEEGEDGGVVTETGSDVYGMVEGGNGVDVGRVVVEEEVEELEGFGAVVPELLEDGVD